LAGEVEERTERFDRSPHAEDSRKRKHTGRPAKAHRGKFVQPPAVASYLDGSPVLVTEIQIDAPVVLCEPDIDRTLSRVKLGPRLEQVEL